MTVDGTRLRILARGNHRAGYTGVVIVESGGVPTEYECGHPHGHTETKAARDCIRRRIVAAMEAAVIAHRADQAAARRDRGN